MDISGFPYLGMPLNLSEPEYLEHVSSVFRFSLRVCKQNLPLCIGPLQFLNSSSYWSSGTIQSLLSLDQVKQFILTSGSVPDQGIIYSLSSLYNPPHCGPSTLTLGYFIAYDRFIITMIDIAPSGA